MISKILAEKILLDVGGMVLLPTTSGPNRFYVSPRPKFYGTLAGFESSDDASVVVVRFESGKLCEELKKKALGLPSVGTDGFECRSGRELGVLIAAARTQVDMLRDEDAGSAASPDDEFDPNLAETEQVTLAKQRRGQALYRQRLEALWGGRCAVTGVSCSAVLRASHAKPWADCASGRERLNPYNGLLLSANLDALFDKFLISFEDDGRMLVSSSLTPADRTLLGLDREIRIPLTSEHLPFMRWHRQAFAKREAQP